MKMMNHTRLWDAELVWYSLKTTQWICYILRIHDFKPTWQCLIIEVLATQGKSLELFGGYFTMINCTVTYCPTNIFGCFHNVIVQFELIKHKLLHKTMLHVHLYGFQITHRLKQCIVCECINYHNITKFSGYLP